MWISPMSIKKFLNVNIINFENVDKPEGRGVGQCGLGYFVKKNGTF